ncbi:MAG TPA: hypothetical protein VGK88_00160 [bacterium]
MDPVESKEPVGVEVTMLAYAERSKIYPVLLPQRWDRPTSRRARANPATRAVIIALVLMLPAVLYVYGRTQIARTGYLILRVQHDVDGLQAQRDRLLATATALKTPERIEHIATVELGMIPPRQQQLATITLAPAVAVRPPSMADRTAWDRLRAWLAGEAEAHEAR